MKNDLRIPLIVTCLLVLALSSCQNSAQDNSQEQPAAPLQQIELTQPQEAALGNSQVAFSIQLLQQACQAAPQGNVCLSPIGVANQLSLIANGTQGETQSQMLRALQVDSIAQSNAYHSLFMSRISQDTTVGMANMVVLQPAFKVLPAFDQIAQEQYRSKVQMLSGNTAKDVTRINHWCAKHTKKMIPNVVDAAMLQRSAMVLLNAVSFDAEWVHQFKHWEDWEETYTFHTPTQDVKANELSDSFEARYCQPADKAGRRLPFSTLCLDYLGEKYEMMIVLPHKGTAADSVIPLLTPGLLQKCSEVKKRLVYLQMPKVDMSGEVPVKKLLQSMGVISAFGSTSDFSLLSQTPTYISDIKQKVALKIDENGTKAAAVTVTEIVIQSAEVEEERPKPIEFIVNRPYLIFLREKSHGTILFAGCINDPTAQ